MSEQPTQMSPIEVCAWLSLRSHTGCTSPTISGSICLPKEIQQQRIGKGEAREAGKGEAGWEQHAVRSGKCRQEKLLHEANRGLKDMSGLGQTILHTSAPPKGATV